MLKPLFSQSALKLLWLPSSLVFLQPGCFDGRLVKPKSWWMDKGKFFMELNFVCWSEARRRQHTVCKTVKNMSPSLAAMIKATRWPEGFKFWRRERNKIATFAVMYHVHVNSFPVCDGTELRHNRGGGEASKYKIQRVPKIKIQKLFEFLKKFWNSRKNFWCPKLPRNTSLWEKYYFGVFCQLL